MILQTGTGPSHDQGRFGVKIVDNDNGVLLNLSSGNNYMELGQMNRYCYPHIARVILTPTIEGWRGNIVIANNLQTTDMTTVVSTFWTIIPTDRLEDHTTGVKGNVLLFHFKKFYEIKIKIIKKSCNACNN